MPDRTFTIEESNEDYAAQIRGNLDRGMRRRIWAGRAVHVGYALGSAALAAGLIGLLIHKIAWPLPLTIGLTIGLTSGGGILLFASLKKHFHLYALKRREAEMNKNYPC